MSQTNTVKVSINNLSFFYGNLQALKNISLPLYLKKVTAFIGPSGCGKSTLLRVMNRIYELYPNQRAEGEVILDGDSDEALANVLQASLRGHLWEVEEREDPELDQDWDDL